MSMTTLDCPVFVLSQHRAGSTLLRNILDRSSEIAMAADEMHVSDPWRTSLDQHYNRAGDLQNDRNLRKLVDLIYSGDVYGTFWVEFRKLGISKDTVFRRLSPTDRSLRSVVSVFLDLQREHTGKPRAGAKFPVHFTRVAKLKEWFPDGKVVFLVRDPRAVAWSKVNDPATMRRKQRLGCCGFLIHYLTLVGFAIGFRSLVKTCQQNASSHDTRIVKYEDLVTAPERTVSGICCFCAVEFQERMLGVDGKPSSHGGRQKGGIDSGSLARWQKEMPVGDRLLVEWMTARGRRYLGYC